MSAALPLLLTFVGGTLAVHRFSLSAPKVVDVRESGPPEWPGLRAFAVVGATLRPSWRGARMEVLVYVFYKNWTYYQRRCEDLAPACSPWFVPSAELPFSISELSCDFGRSGHTSVRDDTCRDCGIDFDVPLFGMDAHVGSNSVTAHVLSCAAPARGLTTRSSLSVTLRGSSRDASLEVPLVLMRDAESEAVTACTNVLFGLDAMSRLRPGLVGVWLVWHLGVLGVDRLMVYDFDGSFSPHYLELEERHPALLAKSIGFGSAGADDVPDVAATWGTSKASRCGTPYMLKELAAAHCLFHSRGRSRAVLSLHAPDIFLVPPRRRANGTGPSWGHGLSERPVLDLVDRLLAEDHLAGLLVPAFESFPSYGKCLADHCYLSWDDSGVDREAAKELLVAPHCRGQLEVQWHYEVFQHHAMRIRSISQDAWPLCRPDLTGRLWAHACIVPLSLRRFIRDLHTTASVPPEYDWHFRHFTFLMPFDCTSKVALNRILKHTAGRSTYDHIPIPSILHGWELTGQVRTLNTEGLPLRSQSVAASEEEVQWLRSRDPNPTAAGLQIHRLRMAGRAESQLVLRGGGKMPVLGLGTSLMKGGVAARAVEFALRSGYRALDTGLLYNNHAAISQGIRASGVRREDVFLTSKVPPSHHGYEKATQAVKLMLSELDTPYVDLCLVHFPGTHFSFEAPRGPATDEEVIAQREGTWRALESAHGRGECRHIGVSNYMVPHLRELLGYAKVLPAVNQIEHHPYMVDWKAARFCQGHSIAVQAFGSLNTPGLLRDPVVLKIASSVRRTPAQVLLRWGVEEGAMVLPKSATEARILENMDLFSFSLTAEQHGRMSELHRGARTYQVSAGVPVGKPVQRRAGR